MYNIMTLTFTIHSIWFPLNMYMLYGCTGVVHVVWVYRCGTCCMGVQVWYMLYGCTCVVHAVWVYKCGTWYMGVQVWYMLYGCTGVVHAKQGQNKHMQYTNTHIKYNSTTSAIIKQIFQLTSIKWLVFNKWVFSNSTWYHWVCTQVQCLLVI